MNKSVDKVLEEAKLIQIVMLYACMYMFCTHLLK